jgi:hypothetical protein
MKNRQIYLSGNFNWPAVSGDGFFANSINKAVALAQFTAEADGGAEAEVSNDINIEEGSCPLSLLYCCSDYDYYFR